VDENTTPGNERVRMNLWLLKRPADEAPERSDHQQVRVSTDRQRFAHATRDRVVGSARFEPAAGPSGPAQSQEGIGVTPALVK